MNLVAEDIVTKTIMELPGTKSLVPGSSRRLAHKIITDLETLGAVITFFPVKPVVVVPSESDIRMRRLVEKDRRDG